MTLIFDFESSVGHQLQKFDRVGGLFLRAGILSPLQASWLETKYQISIRKAHVLAIAVDGIRTGEIEIAEAV